MDSNSPTPNPSDNEQPAKPQHMLRNLPLGKIVVTRTAFNELPNSTIVLALARHCSGDWGEVCEEDWQSNDEAMEVGNRILSAYSTPDGLKFWIITEWDRSVTTILLPEDY